MLDWHGGGTCRRQLDRDGGKNKRKDVLLAESVYGLYGFVSNCTGTVLELKGAADTERATK